MRSLDGLFCLLTGEGTPQMGGPQAAGNFYCSGKA